MNNEPVAIRYDFDGYGYKYMDSGSGSDWQKRVQGEPLYTAPPQRTWVGLTDEERDAIFELHHTRLGGWDYSGDKAMYYEHFEAAVAAIEAKIKHKNT